MRDANGVWTSVEADKVLKYTHSIGGDIAAAELFNEPTFAALGGGLLVLAAILSLAGWLMLRRHAPLPRPERQFRAAKQMMMGSTIARAVTAVRDTEAAKPDATTQMLLGAAAVAAIGWLVISHLGPTEPRAQVRR